MLVMNLSRLKTLWVKKKAFVTLWHHLNPSVLGGTGEKPCLGGTGEKLCLGGTGEKSSLGDTGEKTS